MDVHMTIALVLGAFVLGYLLFEWAHQSELTNLKDQLDDRYYQLMQDWYNESQERDMEVFALKQENEVLASELHEMKMPKDLQLEHAFDSNQEVFGDYVTDGR